MKRALCKEGIACVVFFIREELDRGKGSKHAVYLGRTLSAASERCLRPQESGGQELA